MRRACIAVIAPSTNSNEPVTYDASFEAGNRMQAQLPQPYREASAWSGWPHPHCIGQRSCQPLAAALENTGSQLMQEELRYPVPRKLTEVL